jgi:anti-sigma regulatory factor (Ser/Thr protein kinase)
MIYELIFHITGGDFANAGKASSKIKKVLKQLNVDEKSIKKTVVALYEAEVNVVAHAWRGQIKANISDDFIEVIVSDEGPGIKDLDKAMEPGFSTASKQVREMGFGAGMGLINIKRCVDKMELESSVGKGTKLVMRIYVPTENLNGRKDE